MEQFVIKGGTPLRGEVEIGGAKNAALAILAAAIMTDDTVVIENLPDVRDVNVMLGAMENIGAKVVRTPDRHKPFDDVSHGDGFFGRQLVGLAAGVIDL